MTTSPSPVPWDEFSQDPRQPQAASLRASDQDRDVVLGVLGQGYAEGRLDKSEYDERSQTTGAAKTLGELVPLIHDLVPHTSPSAIRGSVVSQDELAVKAMRHWESQRRQALASFLLPTIICWVIWFLSTIHGGHLWHAYPWPVWVTLGTAINLVRVQLSRENIIAEEQERLEKKQRKALQKRHAQDD